MKKFGVILSILFVLTFGLFPFAGVYADEPADISVTLTSTPSEWSNVFPTCTDTCLDNYDYLTITFDTVITTLSSTPAWFWIRYDGSNIRQFTASYFSTNSIYTLPFNGSANNLLQWRGNLPSEIFNSGVTLTLTNSLGGIVPEGTLNISTNGTYDVSNYEYATVDVSNSSFIVDLFSKGFWGVATAIVSLIVPVFALFLIFRLVHDFFWGRG